MEEEEKRILEKIVQIFYSQDDIVEAYRANEDDRQINLSNRGSKDDERDRC